MSSARLREREPAFARPTYVPPAAAAVLALQRGTCRWPIGDVAAEDFRFCGAPSGSATYCGLHHRLARRAR